MSKKTKVGRRVIYETIDRIMSLVWYYHVKKVSGETKPTAISRKVMPELFQERTSSGRFPSKTQIFSKISRGERAVPEWLVERTSVIYPGTEFWYEHPFRRIARKPMTSLYETHKLLASLRPAVSDLVFKRPPNARGAFYRIEFRKKELDILDHESDLDALTLLLGLMLEAESVHHEVDYHASARTAYDIFLRIISQFPLCMVATELFDYLRETFFEATFEKEWTDFLRRVNIKEHMEANDQALSLINDFNLLEHDLISPSTCIYHAQRCIPLDTLNTLWEHKLSGNLDEIKYDFSFRKLRVTLKAHESELLSR